eukprot:2157162-Prymnesium_polylepis.1
MRAHPPRPGRHARPSSSLSIIPVSRCRARASATKVMLVDWSASMVGTGSACDHCGRATDAGSKR